MHTTPSHPRQDNSRTAARYRIGPLLRRTAVACVLTVAPLAAVSFAATGCSAVGSYTEVVQAASAPVVLEGVARGATASGPSKVLQGDSFYDEPLVLKEADVERLRLVLGSRSSYASFTEEKKCGGFHADFSAQWSDGERSYLTLICFGCDEFKVYGPDISDRYDMTGLASKQLEEILVGYRRHSVKPAVDPAAATSAAVTSAAVTSAAVTSAAVTSAAVTSAAVTSAAVTSAAPVAP